ncbi:MAG: PIN domain-containing protein [Cuspidothrix sp.]
MILLLIFKNLGNRVNNDEKIKDYCPIWTEDQDFFGTGIATWRTKNIEIFFNE